MHTSIGRRFGRRSLAVAASAGLAALSIVAVTGPADASSSTPTQPLTWNVGTTDNAPLYSGNTGVLNVTITNPATNNYAKRLYNFKVIIPAAAGPVDGSGTPIYSGGSRISFAGREAGVSGPGNWTQSIKPCGTISDCSGVLVVSAAAPLYKSGIAPGASVTASFKLTPPNAATLNFRVIDTDDDYYVTPASRSFDVQLGDASDFGVTVDGLGTASTGGSTWVAGNVTHTIHLAGYANLGTNTTSAVAAGVVTMTLGTDDSQATLVPLFGDGTTNPAAVTTEPDPQNSGRTLYHINLPQQANPAVYDFSLTLKTATLGDAQSITFTKGTTVGVSTVFTVIPGAAASLVLDPVTDVSAPPSGNFNAGDTIDVPVLVKDGFGNIIPFSTGTWSLAVSAANAGTGSFTFPLSSTTPTTDGNGRTCRRRSSPASRRRTGSRSATSKMSPLAGTSTSATPSTSRSWSSTGSATSSPTAPAAGRWETAGAPAR